jgi:elongation factor 1-alpha
MVEKQHLNLVFIGHVDHGKSTTIGRLLVETGVIPEHIIEEYKKEAAAKGKATFEFAWVMDALKEERERGLTIDVAHKRFDTQKYYFTIIDCPGHRDFVKNMITGTSQADAAVLIVSAAEGEGVQAQTKEHLFLAKTLGVPQIIVGINKMDATVPAYNEKRYTSIKSELEKLLKSVGYKLEKVPIIPISAYQGDNVTKATDKLGWFKGPTFLQVLDTLIVPEKPIKLPLRLPVQDVYSITGVGTVPVGRVETGILKPGDKIVFQPANVTGEVKTIEMHHERIEKAEPGDNVGFNVRGVSKEEIRRGDVVGHPDKPPTVAKSFTAKIIVLQHPSAIAPGYTPVFHCHTAQVACTFEELKQKLDPKTGSPIAEKPDFLKTGDSAIVKIKPTRPLVIERSQDFPPLGRFAIRDMGQTVAAGLCIEVEKK